ncbi:MAG: hypothetical protein KDD45_07805 [Bdellovibrionales bacterium]|nr:hypothetical protein [Bdellovibrionales bacterium]
MMYLLLSVTLLVSAISQSATVKKSKDDLTIGTYRILDTTKYYPKPNYYEQTLDCTQQSNGLNGVNGGGNSLKLIRNFYQTQPNTPTLPGAPVIAPGQPPVGSNTGTVAPLDPNLNPPQDPNSGGTVIQIPGGNGTGNGNAGGGTIYNPGGNYYDPSGIDLGMIVNIGNIIWSIIDMGRPNAQVQTYRAHALPKGIACWTDLENWQIPVSKVYTIEYKNKLGVVVALYSYRISYVYGGNINGIGKYLANVSVTPVDMRLSWGFNFSSQVQIPATFNMGSRANPVAGMQVFVYWGIGNALKADQRSALYFVAGDGRIQLTESK